MSSGTTFLQIERVSQEQARVKALQTIDPTLPTDHHPEQVWYTSYGSNMHLDRLAAYIQGGRPPGAAREYPGCRNPAMPAQSMPVELTGALYFATESPVWGGGRAFYDPEVSGRVLARAHLVTVDQFSDIAAQEMYREPGAGVDLVDVMTQGRAVLGVTPSAAYVRFLASGLLSAGAWDAEAVASYLAACPGAAGHWSEQAIADLLSEGI
jgi:hypothetical protein